MAQSSPVGAGALPLPGALFTARDYVENIGDNLNAYRALEYLIVPWGAHEHPRVEAPREQLGALLVILNDSLEETLGLARDWMGAAIHADKEGAQ